MWPCTLDVRVGSVPEVKETPNSKVCDFRAAVRAGVSKGGGEVTTWLSVAVWGDMAEMVGAKVGVGDLVRLEGYLLPAECYQRKDKKWACEQKMVGWRVTALEWAAKPLESVKV